MMDKTGSYNQEISESKVHKTNGAPMNLTIQDLIFH